MAGIAGIARGGQRGNVDRMLEGIAHRGRGGREVLELATASVGVVWGPFQHEAVNTLRNQHTAADETGAGHRVIARVTDAGLFLERDPLGVAPLYYGLTPEGDLAFASEVKALAMVTQNVHEFPPGHHLNRAGFKRHFILETRVPLTDTPTHIALELRKRLEKAVERCVSEEIAGSWLSGGLDSSTITALAMPRVRQLHTFAAGLRGAPDLEFAREVAAFIKSDHHETVVAVDDMLKVLPTVIYSLESFDALLVRSSVTNYLVAQAASQYVETVFSGEGGDELFAGYEYLKAIDPSRLPDELIAITKALHNTALQRVDRSASAHGMVAHVVFLDPEVVDYALQIPIQYKLRDGIEKWILRLAMQDALPERILKRPKAKFWEGAGVGSLLAQVAEERITDGDFRREQRLPNGWLLRSKEELLYYRFFKEHYGTIDDLSWMGRSAGTASCGRER